MTDVFSLLLILASIGITISTFWIWRYKTNWSKLKKAVIVILVVIGLITAAFVASCVFWLQEARQGIGIVEVSKPLNKFDYKKITEAELEQYYAFDYALLKAVSIEGYSS